MYQVRRPSRSAFVALRNHRYHLRVWGAEQPRHAPLVLLHGWMDVAASYQFVVDALSDAFLEGRQVLAPDWRGYGDTTGPVTDNYWFPDYMADLDLLLDRIAGERQVDLVGHSLGGNLAMHYGGVRPERLRRLVNMEGFGGPRSAPEDAPRRYARWMDELKAHARGDLALRPYESQAAVARRLSKTNPRLARDATGQARAHWLAGHWARPDAEGRWAILGDSAHKVVEGRLPHIDEMLALYRRLTMPVLAVEASDDPIPSWWNGRFTKAEYHERLRLIPDCRIAVVQDAGHMLHHDQPGQVARLLEDFLG